MHLQYIYNAKENEPHPFHVKSDWDPPVQPSVALETLIEEVKLELAEIEFKNHIRRAATSTKKGRQGNSVRHNEQRK